MMQVHEEEEGENKTLLPKSGVRYDMGKIVMAWDLRDSPSGTGPLGKDLLVIASIPPLHWPPDFLSSRN